MVNLTLSDRDIFTCDVDTIRGNVGWSRQKRIALNPHLLLDAGMSHVPVPRQSCA